MASAGRGHRCTNDFNADPHAVPVTGLRLTAPHEGDYNTPSYGFLVGSHVCILRIDASDPKPCSEVKFSGQHSKGLGLTPCFGDTDVGSGSDSAR
jgi:hypothetical protein